MDINIGQERLDTMEIENIQDHNDDVNEEIYNLMDGDGNYSEDIEDLRAYSDWLICYMRSREE